VYTKGAHSSLATHGGHARALPVQRPGPPAWCVQWLDLVLFCEARVTLPLRCVVHVESDWYSPAPLLSAIYQRYAPPLPHFRVNDRRALIHERVFYRGPHENPRRSGQQLVCSKQQIRVSRCKLFVELLCLNLLACKAQVPRVKPIYMEDSLGNRLWDPSIVRGDREIPGDRCLHKRMVMMPDTQCLPMSR